MQNTCKKWFIILPKGLSDLHPQLICAYKWELFITLIIRLIYYNNIGVKANARLCKKCYIVESATYWSRNAIAEYTTIPENEAQTVSHLILLTLRLMLMSQNSMGKITASWLVYGVLAACIGLLCHILSNSIMKFFFLWMLVFTKHVLYTQTYPSNPIWLANCQLSWFDTSYDTCVNIEGVLKIIKIQH